MSSQTPSHPPPTPKRDVEQARPGATCYGIVVIGRNEGERLRTCFSALAGVSAPILYVDSGSTDGSPALAASLRADVLELDPSRRFSAARARNEGFDRLLGQYPHLSYVQFVDGDCELVEGWLERATAALDARADVSAVAGHVLERHPDANAYTRLCKLEWQKTPGEIAACGGVFMVRAPAFRAVGGFRPDVIAAEDDELCLRLRRSGGRILQLDADMVRHDIGMTRFSQWWQRARRAGHAYAQGADLHGKGPERHFIRDCRRIWLWGLLLPVFILGLALPTRGWSLCLFGAYPLQMVRIYQAGRRRGWSPKDARIYAFFAVLGKLPNLLGLLEYHFRRWHKGEMTIIEHKGAGTPS